jgi:hypothetical protein
MIHLLVQLVHTDLKYFKVALNVLTCSNIVKYELVGISVTNLC